MLSAEDLNNIYYELNVKYFGESIIIDDDIKYEWARIPHFYSCFYVYTYATGISSAISIASKILSGEKDYVEKYRSILEGASYGAIIEDARLLQMPEVISFNGGSRNNVPKSSILRETSFWLGSACSDNSIWIVDAQYQLVDINYLNTVFCGVRPVLVISPSNI